VPEQHSQVYAWKSLAEEDLRSSIQQRWGEGAASDEQQAGTMIFPDGLNIVKPDFRSDKEREFGACCGRLVPMPDVRPEVRMIRGIVAQPGAMAARPAASRRDLGCIWQSAVPTLDPFDTKESGSKG
jgi:hypothetical protein